MLWAQPGKKQNLFVMLMEINIVSYITRVINVWKFISIKIQKFLAYRFPIMLLLLGR